MIIAPWKWSWKFKISHSLLDEGWKWKTFHFSCRCETWFIINTQDMKASDEIFPPSRENLYKKTKHDLLVKWESQKNFGVVRRRKFQLFKSVFAFNGKLEGEDKNFLFVLIISTLGFSYFSSEKTCKTTTSPTTQDNESYFISGKKSWSTFGYNLRFFGA